MDLNEAILKLVESLALVRADVAAVKTDIAWLKRAVFWTLGLVGTIVTGGGIQVVLGILDK